MRIKSKGEMLLTIRYAMRRINRGIVLAIVLLVGLIGYLIVDNSRFNIEKTAIQEMVTAYAGAAGDLNILPANERIAGAKPSQTAVKKKLEENKAVLNRYLTDWIQYESALNSATQGLENVFSQNSERCAYVTDCAYTVKSIKKIKRNGPHHALAEIALHLEMKTIGKPVFFAMSRGSADTVNNNHYGGYSSQNDKTASEIDTKTYTYSWDITMYDVQLEKTDGQWKIACTDGYGYSGEGKLVEY
jgi:hypothetical protein